MKTTNILLGIISILLILNLVNTNSFSLFNRAYAQTSNKLLNPDEQIIKVKIVEVDSKAKFEIEPIANYGGRHILPVTIFDTNGKAKIEK